MHGLPSCKCSHVLLGQLVSLMEFAAADNYHISRNICYNMQNTTLQICLRKAWRFSVTTPTQRTLLSTPSAPTHQETYHDGIAQTGPRDSHEKEKSLRLRMSSKGIIIIALCIVNLDTGSTRRSGYLLWLMCNNYQVHPCPVKSLLQPLRTPNRRHAYETRRIHLRHQPLNTMLKIFRQ